MDNYRVITFLIPVYNEEGNVEQLYNEIIEMASKNAIYDYEILFVNDCSKDKSLDIIKMLSSRDKRVKYLSFEVNAGQSAALAAGFKEAEGDVIITMDADLQNDPSDIPNLLSYYGEYDLVNGWRKYRKDTISKKIGSFIGNSFRNWVTNESIKDTGCSLKVMKSSYVKKIHPFRGFHRFIPTLMRLEGAKVVEIPVNHRPRLSGISKYNNLRRGIEGFYDLIGVRWTIKRHIKFFIRERNG